MKKKKRIGLRIFLGFIITIILLVALSLCYLFFIDFGTDGMRGGWDPEAPYDGQAVFMADGSVEVRLDEFDIYTLALELELDAAIEEHLGSELTAWALELKEGGLNLYADLKYMGFLPAHIKAEATALWQDGRLTVGVDKVMLGRWISLSPEKLGLDEDLVLEASEIDIGTELLDVGFQPGAAVVTTAYSRELADRCADSFDLMRRDILMYGLGDAPLLLARDSGEITEALAGYQDPKSGVADLLALVRPAVAERLTGAFSWFELRYIADISAGDIEASLGGWREMLASGQREYELALTDIRERWKDMELTLTETAITAGESGEPVCPIEGSRAILLYSNEALYTVRTADMPVLADVPRSGNAAIRDIYSDFKYDIGLVLKMPDGMEAVIYYQGDGQFIVLQLGTEVFDELMSAERLPVIMSDTLEKPPTRDNRPAPAPDLCDYCVMLIR